MTNSQKPTTAFLAYQAALQTVSAVSPEIASFILRELDDQRTNLKLIASENFSSPAVQLAMGNLLTDKYAEGVPGERPPDGAPDKDGRFYAGCRNVNEIERLAIDLARRLFNVDHAYVQPHSGADANLVAYLAVLQRRIEMPQLRAVGLANDKDVIHTNKLVAAPTETWDPIRRELLNQKLLGLSLSSGGHLTHGYRANVSAWLFEPHSYSVDPTTGLIDYDKLATRARELNPLILLAGYSAYPRRLDFARLRDIADSCKPAATLVVDMAHFAGLVAGKVFEDHEDPAPYADVITSTTHKTLRGPRGGLVLCTKEYAKFVDRGCPLVLGGPLPHVMAAKAICFTEALRPEFKEYAHRIVDNARALAAAVGDEAIRVVTGGTDNHLVMLDITPSGYSGSQAETALRDCGITLNRNQIPNDPRPPLVTSGLRLGTAAVTTLGMTTTEMREIAEIIKVVLKSDIDPQGAVSATIRDQARRRVQDLLGNHPLYPDITLSSTGAVPAPSVNA